MLHSRPMEQDEAPTTLEAPNGGLCPVCYHWVRIRSNYYSRHGAHEIPLPWSAQRDCPGSYLWATD